MGYEMNGTGLSAEHHFPASRFLWLTLYRITILSEYDINMSKLSGQPNILAMAELRYQIRLFLRFSENAARQAGIEPQQHQLLLAVKGLPARLKTNHRCVSRENAASA